MSNTEHAQLPFLSTDVLISRAKMLEREAATEQARADELRGRIGQPHIGPESFEQLARARQRMADNRRSNAAIYRGEVAKRAGATGAM